MKRILTLALAAVMAISLMACGNSAAPATSTEPFDPGENSVLNTGVLRVGMECAYAPYNWTQFDESNGAAPIAGSSDYACGYDVMMAQKIADTNGWELEIHKTDWDSLPLAVQSGDIDCAIAGQSVTAKREETVDFTSPYYYASVVTLVKADGPYVDATSIADFKGATCTSQINTIWYDKCLPQIEDANILAAQETAPAMLVSLQAGACELVCCDQPTALAACATNPDLKMLDFTGTDGTYEVSEEDVNIGVSCMEGNTALVEKINAALADYTAEDYTEIMNQAIAVQPLAQ